MKKVYYISLIILCIVVINSYQRGHTNPSLKVLQKAWKKKKAFKQTVFLEKQKKWVDSVFQQLSIEEQIGQLFMVAAFYKDSSDIARNVKLIEKYGIGGVIFFKGTPAAQVQQLNYYQSLSKVPLLVGLDAEWGLNMRLDSTINFPKQMTLGAIQDTTLIYQMGVQIGKELRRIGAHVNFAPVVDVNNNPKNPVIGYRSFGENPESVSVRAIAYMKGLQASGIIANAKHFPGHGDTDQDSHLTLPVIRHDSARLQAVELYPFKKMIDSGIKSIMVAHLHVPTLGSQPKQPTTLSPSVVTQKLRKDMGFKGLIFTDALNMKGVTKFYKPGQVDLKALAAGNDVLLYSLDVAKGIETIKEALKNGHEIITKTFIEKKVRKILETKFEVGLNDYKPVDLENLTQDLNTSTSLALKQTLYENALTLINNRDTILPLQDLSNKKVALLNIGLENVNNFKAYSDKYTGIDTFNYSVTQPYRLSDTLVKYDLILVSFYTGKTPKNKFSINFKALQFLQKLTLKVPTIVTVFGSPYSLKYFEEFKTLICAYESDILVQKVVAQTIFGAIGFKGKLPVTVSDSVRLGDGIIMAHLGRLGFAYPESVGLASSVLKNIDTVALNAIENRATPGCQVLVVKDGKVVLHKAYGYQTYEKKLPVTIKTIYDLASLTKILGTLQATMFLDGLKFLNIEKNVSTYLTELVDDDEGKVKIRDILGHQAGLIPFIPYWLEMMEGKKLEELKFNPLYLSYRSKKGYTTEVSHHVFASDYIFDTIWAWTLAEDLLKVKNKFGRYPYQYSDVGFYLLKAIVERISHQDLYSFLNTHFYKPLNLKTLGYQAYKRFDIKDIPPTEYDLHFRKGVVKGYVHDPGAALIGGIAGHAGLFSSALDIAVLLQMNLQKGYYGGRIYLPVGIIDKYTRYSFLDNDNRRGLGWDKPGLDKEHTPTCDSASVETFGHTGFTGTCAWVDPSHNLIYIFLSNRTFPTPDNKNLIKADVRTNIQSIIYDAII